jgi:hypothetical protein
MAQIGVLAPILEIDSAKRNKMGPLLAAEGIVQVSHSMLCRFYEQSKAEEGREGK